MARYRTGSVTHAPYGTWPSPLSPAVMGGARVSLAGLQVVGDTCWWSESRPHQGGRMVVMRLRPGAAAEEVSPPGVSVRSRVHEYGGGAHFAEGDSLLYTDLADQALWWLDPGAEPVRLTPPAPDGRDPSLRRRPARGLEPLPGGSARAPPPGRGGRRAGGRRPSRARGPFGPGRRSRLLRRPPPQPRRAPPGLAGLGPPQHALGRDRTVGGRSRSRRSRRA